MIVREVMTPNPFSISTPEQRVIGMVSYIDVLRSMVEARS
jgi:hypothetical protein